MKLIARFWIALFLIGILSSVVLPSVNAETFDIGEKLLRTSYHQTGYYYSSGIILDMGWEDEELYNNITLMFDGNRTTGIDQDTVDFSHGIKLIFPYAFFVNNITFFPVFGGGTTNYTVRLLYYNSMSDMSESTNKSQVFNTNCFLTEIWIDLDSGYGNNHIYFNDVIINYTPSESSEDKENGNEHDDEDESEFDDLFFEPPFVGLLWLILIIVLILILIGRRSNKKGEPEVTPESTEDQTSSPESDEPEPSEDKGKVEGRFCPNCGKYTEEKGPFCPHCKRSMI